MSNIICKFACKLILTFMKKIFFSLLAILFSVNILNAQIELSTTDLTSLYKTSARSGVSIHDPSVVWDPNTQYFYIYGSHYAGAKTKNFKTYTSITKFYSGGYDIVNAYKAFQKCSNHIVKRCLPGKTNIEEIELTSYDASAFCSTYATIKVGKREPTTMQSWVSGDQWAPDIIWNPNMKKWCMYLSLNGDYWSSVVVLLTSNNPEGPFKYEAPIVFGGFDGQSRSGKSVNYKDTDLEVVLGEKSSLPTRYKTNQWGTYYPNCIDPCTFFDEDGELWLVYGSWSGGIFGLKLDKNTGLRDYTYTYSGTGSTPNATSDDAYFGKRIAGGYYVSGEGPYIQHIGSYYYLFMSYGGFAPDGGYEMRVFRSDKPMGPYKDAAGNSAIDTKYQLNYGPKAETNKGMKLIGAINKWGLMTTGQCAQGHNSACIDDNGRSFLVCHTKFNDGTIGHQVRAYQMYLNKQGWLCTAPFQFEGETVNDDSIASNNPWKAEDVEGDYHVLIHPYKLNHSEMQEATPGMIHLFADGKVTGDYSGTWSFTDEGKAYFQIKLGTVVYSGVMVEQTLEGSTAKTLCFTTVCSTSGSSCGVPCWGYKMQPQYALSYNYQQNSSCFKATTLSNISKNVDIVFDAVENVNLTWTSSEPDVVSEYGKYNPKNEDVSLTLTARMDCGNYYWTKSFNAKAKAAAEVTGDQRTGLVAYYDFDEKPTRNQYNADQIVTYAKAGSGTAPALESDWSRFGKVAHQYFGAQGANSYSRMTNPLLGQDIDGFSVSTWVKRSDDNAWDALWAFFGGLPSTVEGPRFFLTGNTYLGFNDNASNWFDINNPNTKTTTLIKQGEWHLVTVTISKDNGYTVYVDGVSKIKKSSTLNCAFDGSATKDAFDYGKVIDFVKNAKYFYLGLGSFWGSADAYFDDLMIYNRELTADDVKGLNTVLNRVNDMRPESTAIESIEMITAGSINSSKQGIYDLYGRKVAMPSRGVYIVNGKKVLYK